MYGHSGEDHEQKHDTSKLVRALRDDELEKVSGGRKGGAILVFDYEGNALRTPHPAKVTVPDIKLS